MIDWLLLFKFPKTHRLLSLFLHHQLEILRLPPLSDIFKSTHHDDLLDSKSTLLSTLSIPLSYLLFWMPNIIPRISRTKYISTSISWDRHHDLIVKDIREFFILINRYMPSYGMDGNILLGKQIVKLRYMHVYRIQIIRLVRYSIESSDGIECSSNISTVS